MAQIVKIVDVKKSYLPIDPQAFSENMSYTAREDDPEKAIPILCYEGYNFLPTAYGYRSYFSTESMLAVPALTTACDEILSFQSATYENCLIAFCSDGIHMIKAGEVVWTKAVALADDWVGSSIYRMYTWCVIENILYIYRQGHTHVIKIDEDLVVTTHVPSFLNMAGQMGIFRANGRLGFWDSEDSVAWSSAFDLFDFTPSIENMVGNLTFFSVLGRIVTILPHGDGFIVYATKSIVGVGYSSSSTSLWDANPILTNSGVAHPKAISTAQGVKEHFVYSSIGILKIGAYNSVARQYSFDVVLPELYDMLKESRAPVHLTCHAGRYLHFSLVNNDYINGLTSFTEVTVPSLAAPAIVLDPTQWDTYGDLPYISPKETFQFLDSTLWQGNSVVSTDRTLPEYEAPYYCVTYTTPNINTTARAQNRFTKAGGLYKNTVASLDFASVEELVARVWDREFVIEDASEIYKGATGVVEDLYKNIANTRVIHTYAGQYLSEQRSFFPKLYPQVIGLEAEEGTSVMTAMYDFMSTVMEYEKFVVNQYTQLVERVNWLNAQPYHTRYVYGPYLVTPYTISDTYQVESRRYFPVGNVGIIANIKDKAVSYNGLVSLVASIQNYVELDTDVCSRQTVGSAVVSITEAPWRYKARLYRNDSGIFTDPTPYVYYDHNPTVEELVASFAAPEYYVTHSGTGEQWQLEYDTAAVTAGVSLPYNSATCICRNLTTDAISFSFGLAVVPEDTYEDTLYGYTYYTDTSDLYVDYIGAGYTYLGAINKFNENKSGFYTTGSIGQMAISWHYAIFNNSSLNNAYESLLGITYSINGAQQPEIEVLPNGDIACKAYIRQNVGDPWTLQTIFIIRTAKILKYEIREELLFGLIPRTRNELIENPLLVGADFYFHVSQVGVDTIDNSVGALYATNKVVLQTTDVIDPGVGLPLDFSPDLAAYYYYNLINPAGVSLPIQSCTPWKLRYGSAPNYIINGQHFMAHSAGLMLDVEQELGPIAYLSDTENACYPNLDSDGWPLTIELPFTYPGATYTLQDGMPVPAYPLFYGSLVYDLHLQKWGKNKNRYYALVEFAPLNSTDTQVIPYTNFGMDSGILNRDKEVALFSMKEADSLMRYGKFGMSRLGFTTALEIILHFRNKSTGTITVEGSIDGRNLETGIQHTENFVASNMYIVHCTVSARWHTVAISGDFDLQFLEFRGKISSRR